MTPLERFAPKRLLVTGGAGFIGSNFIHELLSTNREVSVINLDRLTYAGRLDNLEALPDPDRYEFIQGDICDADLVGRIFEESAVDAVIHFAAESHVDRSIDGPAEFVRTNVVGTFTLLEAARVHWLDRRSWGPNDCRFHHISTDEVFGSLRETDPAFHEETRYQPNSPYSAAKASSDHLVRAYQHTYGLPTVLSIFSNNFVPRQHYEKLIPTVIRACYLEQPIPVYGDGSNRRDWLYVTDHCRGLSTVLERGVVGESYNIGGGCELSNLEIVQKICRHMDERKAASKPYESLIEFVTDRPGHDWRYAVDFEKIERELAWRPQEDLDSGLVKTIDWYLGNSHWRKSVEDGQGGERLGLQGDAR